MRGQFVGRRQHRPVAGRVHHAKKPKRFARVGAELMPGPAGDGDQVELFDVADLVTDHALAAAAQDHHGMGVLVTLQ